MREGKQDDSAVTPAGEPGWRLPSWIALCVGILLLVAATLIGEMVTSRGAAGTGELAFSVDLSKDRNPIGVVLSQSISTVLGPIMTPVLVLVSCVFLWRRNARLTAALLPVLAAFGWLASGVVKRVVNRGRPPSDVVNAVLLENAPDSFPSGHTALTTAVFAALVTIAWMLRRRFIERVWITVVGVVVVGVVAASRLYLGVHYLYDVLAAPLVAIGGVLVAAYLVPRLMLLLAGRSTRAAGWLDSVTRPGPPS